MRKIHLGLVVLAALLIAAIFSAILIYPAAFGSGAAALGGGGHIARRLKASQLIHVCLCTDDPDLRNVAVAIRSVQQSAATPELLRFHLITPSKLKPLAAQLLAEHLPDVHIKVHTNSAQLSRLYALAAYRRPGMTASRSLSSPFALAPFYLDGFLGKNVRAKRVIYVDTSALVLGDVGELLGIDMQDRACAAVKSCMNRWGDLINFEEMKKLGTYSLNPNACAASRAILVIDLPKWRAQQVSSKIEDWIDRYGRSPTDLWIGGMALVPWLLAIGDDYARIGEEWSCNGLASEGMSVEESAKVRRSGFDKKALRKLKVQIDEFGNISPYLATCSATAKLLEFSGTMLPWRMERFDKQAPLCQLPAAFYREAAPAVMDPGVRVRVWCEVTTFVNCSSLWSSFMTEQVACALKDFDREWQGAEDRWTSLKAEHEWEIEQAHQDKVQEAEERQFRDHLAFLKSLEGEAGDDKVEKKFRKKSAKKKDDLQKRQERKTREVEAQLEREEQNRVDRERRTRLGLDPVAGTPTAGGASADSGSVGAAVGSVDSLEAPDLQGEHMDEAAPTLLQSADADIATGRSESSTVEGGASGDGEIVEMKDFGDILGSPGK